MVTDMHTYRITYDIVTEESAEDGDYADHGFIDTAMTRVSTVDAPCGSAFLVWIADYSLDHALYVDDDEDPVDAFLKELRLSESYVEPSSSVFDDHVWYTGESRQDYLTGEWERHSYHLEKGWTTEEKRRVFDALTKRR